jgi:hypothetical protein
MIDVKTARRIAATYLREGERNSCRWTASIQDRFTREHDFGWVFSYQTPEFIATGDVRTSLISNAPLIVDRRDGWISWTGTAYDVSVYEDAYRRWRKGRERREHLEGVPYKSWFRRLDSARARKRAEEFLGAGVRSAEGVTPVITSDPPRGSEGVPRSEFPFGWIFEWDSKEYLETKDPRFLISGQGDVVVLRDDGKVFETGNLYRPTEYLERLLVDGRLRPQEGGVCDPRRSVGLTRNVSPYAFLSLAIAQDFAPAASMEEVRTVFSRVPEGSQGMILGHRTGAVGHTFNFVRQGQEVDLIDLQIGRRAWLDKPLDKVWYTVTDGLPDPREPLELGAARALAQSYLDLMPKDDGIELVVTNEQASDGGWFFFYRSEQPMTEAALVGALLNRRSPLQVDRYSRRVSSLSPEMSAWADERLDEMHVKHKGAKSEGTGATSRLPKTKTSASRNTTGGSGEKVGSPAPREQMPREFRLAFAAMDELRRGGILPPPEEDIYANTTGVYSAIGVDAALGAIDANEGLPDDELVRIAAAAAADELDKFRRGEGRYKSAFDQMMGSK